ncbi:MAG: hypothetical protein ACLRWL_06130 [Evtepia gabavorous]
MHKLFPTVSGENTISHAGFYASSAAAFFFSFFPEISGFISLRKEFSSVSSVSFSSFSRFLCHFVLRRFAQAPFSLP